MIKTIAEFDAIFQHIGYAITVNDMKNKLVYVNKLAAQMAGFPSGEAMISAKAEDIVNKFIFMDAKGDPFPIEKFPGSLTMIDGKVHEATLRYKTKSVNKECWALLKSVPIFKKNKMEYIVTTIQDVTKAKVEEERMGQFIAMASHEFKTPLASIKAISQLLTKRCKEKKYRQAVRLFDKIEVKVGQMTKIVNDFLDMSRIRSGHLAFSFELFDLNTLIDEIINEFRQYSATHTIMRKGTVKRLIYSDSLRISQILMNLIRNARKYSPRSDRVIVSVKEHKRFVTVSVQDFGIGIPEKYQEKLFEPFFRIAEGKTDKVDGLGIGLFMSEHLINALGGKIWLQDSSQKGSTFCLRLPYKLIKHATYKF